MSTTSEKFNFQTQSQKIRDSFSHEIDGVRYSLTEFRGLGHITVRYSKPAKGLRLSMYPIHDQWFVHGVIGEGLSRMVAKALNPYNSRGVLERVGSYTQISADRWALNMDIMPVEAESLLEKLWGGTERLTESGIFVPPILLGTPDFPLRRLPQKVSVSGTSERTGRLIVVN